MVADLHVDRRLGLRLTSSRECGDARRIVTVPVETKDVQRSLQ